MNLASVIERFFSENDVLVIPGFGTLSSKYKPAAIDHVQGLIHAPSKALTFEEDEKANSDDFANFLVNSRSIDLEKAHSSIDEFVEQIKQALARREIVIFPNVGRLYRDYEHNLKFLQDNTNFNSDSVGLPTLQFYPILRSKEATLNKIVVPGHVLVTNQKKKRKSGNKIGKRIRALSPLFAGLLVVGAAIGLYFATKNRWNASETATSIPVKEVRINEKPSLDKASIVDFGTTSIEESDEVVDVEEVIKAEDDDLETNIDTEALTYGPSQRECVIIIGAYKEKAGLEMRIAEIIDLGLDVYQDKSGGMTRIGVQFLYEDEYELRRILEIVRVNLEDRCWILKE